MQAIKFVFVPYPVPCAGVTHWRNPPTPPYPRERERGTVAAESRSSGSRPQGGARPAGGRQTHRRRATARRNCCASWIGERASAMSPWIDMTRVAVPPTFDR